MHRTMITTGVAAIVLLAACSSGDDTASTPLPADTSPGSDTGVTTPAAGSGGSPATTADPPGDTDPGSDDPFEPTVTDRPFDLSGGATSGDDVDVDVVADEPRAGLSESVLVATEPWDTDWTRRTVDPAEFLLGIQTVDPRDRIPPIDTPRFEPIGAADWLGDREPGALVQFGDEARFYPLSILTRHEIVNDRYGDIPVAVTYCPLCNTALAFDARVDGQALRFGVSGLLRNSDLVMWDDATTSLWQQITGEAIVGEFAGTRLEVIPTSIVSYADARESFPDAVSLSRDTGFGIAYGANPYVSYSSSPSPFLFDGEPDPRHPALSRVVGVTLDGVDRAYPFATISELGAVNDEVAGRPIAVLWGGDTADALDTGTIADGLAIGTGIAYDREVDGRVLTFSSVGDDLFVDDRDIDDVDPARRGGRGPARRHPARRGAPPQRVLVRVGRVLPRRHRLRTGVNGRPPGSIVAMVEPADAEPSRVAAMRRALDEARAAVDHDDVPVGAVVLLDGEVIAARHNERELTGDPTAHAEILAMRDAAAHVGHWRLLDCTLVVTLEPCTMCAGAMVNARLGRLVFGDDRPQGRRGGECVRHHRLGAAQPPGADRGGCPRRRVRPGAARLLRPPPLTFRPTGPTGMLTESVGLYPA